MQDADDGDHSTSNDRKVATVDGLASAARKRARLEIPQSSGEAQVTSSRKDDSPQKAERRSATTPRSSRLVDAQRTVGTEKMHPHAGDGDLGTKTPGSASRKPHSVDPPRRVQKNPQFLQEHRERYEAGSKHRRKFLDGNYDTLGTRNSPLHATANPTRPLCTLDPCTLLQPTVKLPRVAQCCFGPSHFDYNGS